MSAAAVVFHPAKWWACAVALLLLDRQNTLATENALSEGPDSYPRGKVATSASHPVCHLFYLGFTVGHRGSERHRRLHDKRVIRRQWGTRYMQEKL